MLYNSQFLLTIFRPIVQLFIIVRTRKPQKYPRFYILPPFPSLLNGRRKQDLTLADLIENHAFAIHIIHKTATFLDSFIDHFAIPDRQRRHSLCQTLPSPNHIKQRSDEMLSFNHL